MNGHLSGKKYTAGHTSVIEAAVPALRAVSRLDSVRKISLGIIKAVNNGPVSIKLTDIGPGCLLIRVRGARSIQEIRIYASDKEALRATIDKEFKY